uniref:Uncharacterized protein n=1 Tax=Chromera velia CCMP2878 TaxID=1169474 RepID=A0A0G4FFS4_9ALVE|eukprot:Cvel_16702.t1-p1 / transcript=Cvel_16702.t1 / gene=Cvel_16702 / organism=Chromera_velia_CCMP2878 / gene_product=hypothetical protein / transcript_product=hypothetical protein / location=Cvel_scaffold1297:15362-15682(+) / protein_length=107 / sequence_SO=supercontig / SO=protein_coding / is_pseudo=false
MGGAIRLLHKDDGRSPWRAGLADDTPFFHCFNLLLHMVALVIGHSVLVPADRRGVACGDSDFVQLLIQLQFADIKAGARPEVAMLSEEGFVLPSDLRRDMREINFRK